MSLPEGGAIRGSGKFAANPVTGMGSVTAYNRGTSPNFRREEIVVDDLHGPSPPRQLFALDFSLLMALSSTGSAARASVRRIGRSRFRDFGEVGDPGDSGSTGELPWRASATLRAPAFAILQTEGFAAASAPTTPPASERQTFTASRDAVRLLNRAGARFLTVPLHELAAVARIGGSVNHA